MYGWPHLDMAKWWSSSQSLVTNSPAPWPGASPASALGTRSYETRSRDQRGKIEMLFSSTSACTATKSLIANHRRPIDAQLYFASVTQMFLMLIFVKVESDSRKLLRTVSKSGPREWVQGTLKTAENFYENKNRGSFRTIKSNVSLDDCTLPRTTTGRTKNDSYMKCSQNYNMVIKCSGVVPPGDIGGCTKNKSLKRNAHLSRGAD